MAKQISLKQLAINKDNTTIAVAIGLASFIVVFSLVASNALLKQRSYQAKVISKKQAALKQLKANAGEVEKLKVSYQAFASAEQNVLGGSSKGQGDKDGENPRLILDALPSKYDFPALATSLEKVFKQYTIDSLTGTDEEVAQAQAAAEGNGAAQPVEIPFAVGIKVSANAGSDAMHLLERSIRPIQVDKLSIKGEADVLKLEITGKTYYQPLKKFDIKTETVK